MTQSISARSAASWLVPSIGAIVASAAHIAIDFAADVLPSGLRGHLLVTVPALALYAVWVRALTLIPSGARGAIQVAAITALVQAGLANGLIGLFPCPPVALWGAESPCPFSPWQDFAHLGSLIFGFTAFFALRRQQITSTPAEATLFRVGAGVLVLHTLLVWVAAVTA